MAFLLTALMQLAGLGLAAYGAFLLAPWVGFAVAGLVLFVCGYLIEPKGVSDVPTTD